MFHFRSTLLAAKRGCSMCCSHESSKGSLHVAARHQTGDAFSEIQQLQSLSFSKIALYPLAMINTLLWKMTHWSIMYHHLPLHGEFAQLWNPMKKNMAQLLINLAMKSYEKKLLVTNNLPVRPALGPRQGLQHDFLGALFVASLGAHYRPAIA